MQGIDYSLSLYRKPAEDAAMMHICVRLNKEIILHTSQATAHYLHNFGSLKVTAEINSIGFNGFYASTPNFLIYPGEVTDKLYEYNFK